MPSVPLPPPGFERLSVQEKVDHIQSLWDGLADLDDVELLETHRDMIRQRIAEHRADPAGSRPWSEVKRDIELRLAERSHDE